MTERWTLLQKLIWLKVTVLSAVSAVLKTVTGTAPLSLTDAIADAIFSLTQYGKCEQDGTPTPDASVDIVCNNGRVVAGNCISSIPDGQGTFVTPSEWTTNRIYKAFPTSLAVGRSYTVTVTGATWSFIVQRKKPDGTNGGNVSAWVTTYDFVPEDGYIYGIALRIGGGTATITPADFNGTLTLDTTDGKPWADGTPEVLTVRGKNLYNKADGVIHGYPSSTGTWKARSGEGSELSIIVTLEEGKTYTAQRASGANCPFRVMGSANRPLTNGQSLQIISAPNTISDVTTTFTVPSGYPHIVFYVRNNAGATLTIDDVVNAFQVELGSTATPYEPYHAPQTVNDIPMLLSVGDTKDEVEIISGTVKRKTAIIVLTGNERVQEMGTDCWSVQDYAWPFLDNMTIPLCSHFAGADASAPDPDLGEVICRGTRFDFGFDLFSYNPSYMSFSEFLAEKYAAGTPVILVAALFLEEGETVTAQHLDTAEGTNTITVTAEVSGITLTAEYMGKDAA